MSQTFTLGIGQSLNNLTLVLLILHVLGDFHLQSDKIAKDKARASWKAFSNHIAIIVALAMLVFLLEPVRELMIILTLAHIALDLLKIASNRLLEKKVKNLELRAFWQSLSYVVDQLAHFAIIIVLANSSLAPTQMFFINRLNHEALLLVLMFVLITKPANVSFKIFFSRFADDLSPTLVQPVAGAGAIIGTMERIITALLLLVNQYAAIGLIFTAKSIARYDRISKSQKFAEYYLIGSLFSILWVVICYMLLFA